MMTPTAWDIRNTLTAILNAAQRSGDPYVDIEMCDIDGELSAERKPGSDVMYRDIMTKMMRPGDTILKDIDGGEDGTIVVRYVFDPNHSVA